MQEPAILVNTTALGDSAVILLVRCHTKAADFWDTRLDLIRSIKERLDDEGISIPFPQRDVHLAETPGSTDRAFASAARGDRATAGAPRP